MSKSWEPTSQKAEGNTDGAKRRDTARRPAPEVPPGSRAGHVWRGSPRNLGGPDFSVDKRRNRERRAKRAKRGGGTSERVVVATKRGNPPEGPRGAKGGAGHGTEEGKMEETSGSVPISTRLERIATLARQLRDQPLTTLAHHIDLEWLREAHRRTRKDGATGVDGQSADEYATQLEDNLRSLLERAKSGTYRALPEMRAVLPAPVPRSDARPARARHPVPRRSAAGVFPLGDPPPAPRASAGAQAEALEAGGPRRALRGAGTAARRRDSGTRLR